MGSGEYFRFNAGPLNIMFALVNAIIGNYIGCAISGKGKISLESITIGTLAGGILIGALAEAIQNIGAAMTIGLGGGLFLGIFMTKVH